MFRLISWHSIMIQRYKRTLVDLFTRVRNIYNDPEGYSQECLEVQEILIKKISYTEKRIRISKNEIKVLKLSLRQKNNQLTKDEAKIIKQQIQKLQSLISDYQSLQKYFRSIGDAIAFCYINSIPVKPLAAKEPPVSLSGKKGSRMERMIMRNLFAQGQVVILNDLTNCLRYGDLTIPIGDRIMVVEVKSKAFGINGKYWRDKLNQIGALATDEGIYLADVEPRLIYYLEMQIPVKDQPDSSLANYYQNNIEFIRVEEILGIL